MLSDLTQGQEYEISTSYSFMQKNEIQHCCQGEAVKCLTLFFFFDSTIQNEFFTSAYAVFLEFHTFLSKMDVPVILQSVPQTPKRFVIEIKYICRSICCLYTSVSKFAISSLAALIVFTACSSCKTINT